MSEKDRNKDYIQVACLGMKHCPAFGQGGVEVVVEELSTRMVRLGCKVTCFNRNGRYEKNNKLKEYKGIKLVSVPTLDRRGVAAASSSFSAAVRAAFGKFDVVHFHAEGSCAMMWLPKLFGKRCIATVHGLDHQRSKWGNFASKYILFGEKCAVKHADEIIVLSRGVQDYFMNTYGRETKYIPNGVNRPVVREANLIEQKYELKKDSYILYLARLVPEKGLKYLIKAFKQVKTDKKLVIAGGSSDTDPFVTELKEMAKGDDRILFTGFVRGELLDELYSNAYVYTLPSDLEGMPLSLLEAMSYGNCCLVSDIAECTEVVEDKAVIFRKSDVDDLRDKLQSLCDDEQKVQDYKSQSADFIFSKCSWDDVVEKTLELYKK